MNSIRRIVIFPLSCMLILSVLPSCSGRRTQNTGQMEQQAERERRIESLLDDFQKQIDELNAGMKSAAEGVREVTGRTIEDLRMKHREASERLKALKDATNTAWGDVNAELQQALDRLQKAYEAAKDDPRSQPQH